MRRTDGSDGGSAFPHPHANDFGDGNNGMSLRDYLAAKSLTGILAGEGEFMTQPKAAAERAYKMADAMLIERAK